MGVPAMGSLVQSVCVRASELLPDPPPGCNAYRVLLRLLLTRLRQNRLTFPHSPALALFADLLQTCVTHPSTQQQPYTDPEQHWHLLSACRHELFESSIFVRPTPQKRACRVPLEATAATVEGITTTTTVEVAVVVDEPTEEEEVQIRIPTEEEAAVVAVEAEGVDVVEGTTTVVVSPPHFCVRVETLPGRVLAAMVIPAPLHTWSPVMVM
jgi:hypothetical protein